MTQAVKREKRARRRLPFTLAGLLRGLRLVAVIAAIAALGWGGFALYVKYDVPVAVIGVKGELKQVKASDVEQIVAASLGGGFLSLDLAGIVGALEKHPWIASSSARRKWPNEVVITVEEETPIARWGDERFLNNQGQVLDVADARLSATLPLLDGPEGMERRVMQQYRNFSQILRPLEMKVGVCRLAPRGNWILTLDNGMELTVGKEPVAEKMGRFIKVWEQSLVARLDDVGRVDIRYANGVAVKWKEKMETADATDRVNQGTMNGKY